MCRRQHGVHAVCDFLTVILFAIFATELLRRAQKSKAATLGNWGKMEFQVLSHACLLVRTASSSLVIDPWLLGSCYWRSWWHFPEAQFDEVQVRAVDAVVISHVHWDHWHGATLKKLFPGKPIYIADEPGLRSERDLKSIGFTDIHRVSHGKTVCVGDIKITLYQFGLHINDAAIVVEANGVCLLNANDAKIAGWPLRHLLSRHGAIDFAFRSHSSANALACFQVEDGSSLEPNIDDRYFRSFCAFMDQVRPRFAVPFASNHCHLHPDSYSFNSSISNPLQLRAFVQRSEASKRDWSLQVMLPGSIWVQNDGFKLASEHCFEDIQSELIRRSAQISEKLSTNADYESRVVVDKRIFERFGRLLRSLNLKSHFEGYVFITINWPDGHGLTRVFNLQTGESTEAPYTKRSVPGIPLAIFPAVVFRDSVIKNMFHHACISKRCRFTARSDSDMSKLRALIVRLELVELGRYPFQWQYFRRFVAAYLRRWRELFVYAHALWLTRFLRVSIYHVEEAVIRGQLTVRNIETPGN